ncbi:Protein kinase superfamily protein [Perilla frutescens var. frutescens]|nr:Protein kinase superfamily protein [Perilla frutescens var. frutescens]
MRYIRTASLKRLFSLKRHAFDEEQQLPKDSQFTTQGNKAAAVDPSENFQKPTWKCYSYHEIFSATNGFSSDNMVGKGGYAEVYRGVLEDGQAIAVKRLTKAENDERKEKEFLTEIGTLGHVSHPNVTALLGCCIDNGLYLIFQFSSKGSVASLLHAKWLPSQWSHHSIAPIEGTFGHLAPEYFMHGVVDEKTDVFAFGVFLLELISGKKPVDSSHQSLHSWAKPILNRGDIKEVIDPRLGEDYNVNQLKRLAFAASLCIRASPIWRPTMSEVMCLLSVKEFLLIFKICLFTTFLYYLTGVYASRRQMFSGLTYNSESTSEHEKYFNEFSSSYMAISAESLSSP